MSFQFTAGRFKGFADDGTPLTNGRLYTYASGTTTFKAAYTDATLGTACTYVNDGTGALYIALDARGEAQLWLGSGAYSFALKTSAGAGVWTVDGVQSPDDGVASIRSDLASTATGKGGSLVAQKAAEAGSVATDLAKRASEALDAINNFGCDNTGTTNTTAALLAFYNACITSGKTGRIRKGTYKVTTGVLKFDAAQTNKVWPNIETDPGVTFSVDSATATDAPVLEWTNGTALSSSTYQWIGGSHGGLTITDATGATAANRCGISLKGVKGLQFTGRVIGNNLRSDLIRLPQALYGGNNPDPYAVSDLRYDVFEANGCVGYAINNLNFVGQDSWVGNGVRAIGGGGGIFGAGSGCKFGELVVANCAGYGFDDGTWSAATGGPPQRNYITIAELDNVQFPLRINKTSNTIFLGLRIIHRFQTSPNASANYWPRKCIDLSGGSSPNITNVSLQVFHRIEGGGILANLGTFCDLNSSGNISGLNIDVDYADNGALGVTDALMFSNVSTSGTIYAQRKSKVLIDSRDKALSFAIGSAATSIPNAGLAAIVFPTQRFPTYSEPYNTSTGAFTAGRRGLYNVQVALPLTVAIGTRIRIQLVPNGTTRYCEMDSFQVNAGSQVHTLSGTVLMAQGDTLQVYADNNSGAAITCTPQQADDVRFVVFEI